MSFQSWEFRSSREDRMVPRWLGWLGSRILSFLFSPFIQNLFPTL